MKKFFLVLFSCLFISIAEGQVNNFVQIKYTTLKGDSFSRILRSFMKDDSVVNAKSPSVRETIKVNPHLDNKDVWMNPPVGTAIDLRIEKDLLDSEKMKNYEASLKKEKLSSRPLDFSSEQNSEKSWRGSLFYMASMGSFKQTSSTYSSVNYQQNSYLSFGLGLSYAPISSLWSYSTSAYISNLKATGSNLNDDKVNVPNEVGAAFYAERFLPHYGFIAYGGLDYDSFSTFNLRSITVEEKIYVDKNSIYYLTLGASKKVSLFDKNFLFKFSISRSVLSSYSSSATNPGDEKLSGQKAMLYINTKISDNVYFHSLVKYHSMNSSFDLSVLRIGVGIGYIFF